VLGIVFLADDRVHEQDLSHAELERRRGGVPAARQVVGVQTGQGERLRQVARDADARGEADHAARRADDVEGRRVMRAERVAHHPVARAPAVHLAQKIHRAHDLPLLPLAGERVQPDVLGAVAADLHAVLHHAAELLEVHVELARDDARIDADVLIEEPADDLAADARRQPLLEHALHERYLRPVEAGGDSMSRVERSGRGQVGVAARVDHRAHSPGQRVASSRRRRGSSGSGASRGPSAARWPSPAGRSSPVSRRATRRGNTTVKLVEEPVVETSARTRGPAARGGRGLRQRRRASSTPRSAC